MCLLSVAMVVGVMGVPRSQAREGSDGQVERRALPTLYGHSRSCGEGAVGRGSWERISVDSRPLYN